MGSRKHNPERRAWRGRSHKKGGDRVRQLRDIASQLRQLAPEFAGTRWMEDNVEHAAELLEDAAGPELEFVGRKCGIRTPVEHPDDTLPDERYQEGDTDPCVMCDKPGCWVVVKRVKRVRRS